MGKKGKPEPNSAVFVTGAQLAILAGYSTAKTNNLIREAIADPNGPRKSGRGKYNALLWMPWFHKYEAGNRQEDSPEHQTKLVKLERERFELDRVKERLISADEAKAKLEGWALRVRRTFDRAATELATRTAGKTHAENQKAIQAWVDVELKALSGE